MDTRRGRRKAGPGEAPAPSGSRITADDFDPIVQKLKLLEFGLYGLQESGRISPLDIEDLGPFVRLAEEIGSDVEALQGRLEAGAEAGRSV
jgi:hypothetical protein